MNEVGANREGAGSKKVENPNPKGIKIVHARERKVIESNFRASDIPAKKLDTWPKFGPIPLDNVFVRLNAEDCERVLELGRAVLKAELANLEGFADYVQPRVRTQDLAYPGTCVTLIMVKDVLFPTPRNPKNQHVEMEPIFRPTGAEKEAAFTFWANVQLITADASRNTEVRGFLAHAEYTTAAPLPLHQATKELFGRALRIGSGLIEAYTFNPVGGTLRVIEAACEGWLPSISTVAKVALEFTSPTTAMIEVFVNKVAPSDRADLRDSLREFLIDCMAAATGTSVG